MNFQYKNEAPLTELFAVLKENHPALQVGTRSNELNKILRGLSTIMDALNILRNKASLAHPNADLLGNEEAMLAINAAWTTFNYLDAKFSAQRVSANV